jgi:hypothetical protein
MEADWEFEVGGDAPVIEACWPGFVDLRWTPRSARDLPARVRRLPEVIHLPALAAVLERLNSQSSPVWTSKCDFWPVLGAEEFDADELDAPAGCSAHAMGCYVDLLPRSDQQWPSSGMVEAACKELCARLRVVPLRCCRVDLIVRRAQIAPDSMGTGITAYITAGGTTAGEARSALETALATFADVVCPQSTLQ